MNGLHLIPSQKQEFFYSLVEGTLAPYIYKQHRKRETSSQAAEFSQMQRIYTRLALASLDLNFDTRTTADFLRELAYASKLQLDTGSYLLPVHALRALAAFQMTVTKRQTAQFARMLLEHPSPRGTKTASPHLAALVTALCQSILDDTQATKTTLKSIGRLGALPSKRKDAEPWLASMRKLAHMCLIGPPTDLTHLLMQLTKQTETYFRPDFEDQNFEPFFGMMTLAFLARARDRGFAFSQPNIHPSLPFRLLGFPRRPLPDHPWHTWPRPDKRLIKRIKKEHSANSCEES